MSSGGYGFPSPETFPVAESEYVLIGSRALGTRRSSDIDILCRKEDLPDSADIHRNGRMARFDHCGIPVECYLVGDVQDPHPIRFLERIWKRNREGGVASTRDLFLLKDSHIHRPQGSRLKWEKHIHDWHALRQMMTTYDWEWATYARRRKNRADTDKFLGEIASPRLRGLSKEEFFNDGIAKKYDHDDLHRAVAYRPGKPLYEQMQEPGSPVECSRDLWNEFSHSERRRCVREECYVIALERFLIPKVARQNVQSAFLEALYKVCTTLTSGWFRDYAIENYFDIANGAALAKGYSYYDRFIQNGSKYVKGFAE